MDDVTKTLEPGAPSPEELAAMPQMIGAYKIQSILKRGGMSLIYLASHPKTGETVAVKVVLPKYLKNKEMLSRQLREAKILSLATHPNIVRLYDLGRGEHGLFIVMEFIQGVSLRQFIKTHSLTHQRALEIVLEIAYALLHLHSHGIIHRDLKPDNILITESGRLKLIDFGISHFVEAADAEDKTGKKGRMGTPNYMSPEQKEKPYNISFGTDIFSLGIIAYELYLGHLSHGIVQIGLLPNKLRKIIGKALEIDPAKRYTEIVDFIADISAYLKENGEKDDEALSEESYEIAAESREILAPSSPPAWAELEIGVKVIQGQGLGSLYLDYFRLSPTRFGLVAARPQARENDPKNLARTAILCGMCRFAGHETQLQIPLFLEKLNRLLFEAQTPFSVGCLWLDISENRLAYAACGRGSLFHFSSGGAKKRQVETPNPALGEKPAFEIVEAKEGFSMDEALFFSRSL